MKIIMFGDTGVPRSCLGTALSARGGGFPRSFILLSGLLSDLIHPCLLLGRHY